MFYTRSIVMPVPFPQRKEKILSLYSAGPAQGFCTSSSYTLTGTGRMVGRLSFMMYV
jgi:hypothetical protein